MPSPLDKYTGRRYYHDPRKQEDTSTAHEKMQLMQMLQEVDPEIGLRVVVRRYNKAYTFDDIPIHKYDAVIFTAEGKFFVSRRRLPDLRGIDSVVEVLANGDMTHTSVREIHSKWTFHDTVGIQSV